MFAVLGLLFELDVCCFRIAFWAKCKHVWMTLGILGSLAQQGLNKTGVVNLLTLKNCANFKHPHS